MYVHIYKLSSVYACIYICDFYHAKAPIFKKDFKFDLSELNFCE